MQNHSGLSAICVCCIGIPFPSLPTLSLHFIFCPPLLLLKPKPSQGLLNRAAIHQTNNSQDKPESKDIGREKVIVQDEDLIRPNCRLSSWNHFPQNKLISLIRVINSTDKVWCQIFRVIFRWHKKICLKNRPFNFHPSKKHSKNHKTN